MAGIRGKDTKPERIVRSILHRAGFRFRLHVADLPGKPDIVLPKWRTVVFVHGCFWHGHDCPLFKMPRTRRGFWSRKIARNAANDQRACALLSSAGWKVVVVWECALKGRHRLHPTRASASITRAVRRRGGRGAEIGGQHEP